MEQPSCPDDKQYGLDGEGDSKDTIDLIRAILLEHGLDLDHDPPEITHAYLRALFEDQ